MTRKKDAATEAYTSEVARIVGADGGASGFRPGKAVELFVRNRRAPKDYDELSPIEQRQIEAMFGDMDARTILRTNSMDDEGDDFPVDLEVADVVDETGTLLYRLWGMNYGAIYLMAPDRLACIAFAAQHDLEHWHADQRDLFWAMDRAIRRKDHGFQQPMKFCWKDDRCWSEIADKPRGTVASEPVLRELFNE